MNRPLVLIGICCIVAGLLWPWLRAVPLGRFPGDIVVVRENFRFFFPLTSCVVVSVLLTILFWLFRK
ncbi:DUF2905 domain-containing protein [uncultured Desulfobulbus sp.]|uniref:DUF2905 domain-containing protein n=1 Tax=uncultured Desulfobulbus sp. TaxID=239745 RepID=UPI0029C75633|nr:DUF2905 domain-containing protein [uncultured Desulfobulbus sp.]